MSNMIVAGFFACIILILAIFACVLGVRIIIVIVSGFLACYKCLFPDGEPNSWHIGCCCCDIMVDCNRGLGSSCSNLPRYCIAQTRMLSSKIHFHCCNQWGCMARHFGCRCCRKSIKKIVPIKKHYTDNHIIIINPHDNIYKLGTVSKTVNIV